MASEKVSRVQPCCSDIGCSQKPKPCRTPIASETMMPLAISTVESFGAAEVLNISDSKAEAVREFNACSKHPSKHITDMYQRACMPVMSVVIDVGRGWWRVLVLYLAWEWVSWEFLCRCHPCPSPKASRRGIHRRSSCHCRSQRVRWPCYRLRYPSYSLSFHLNCCPLFLHTRSIARRKPWVSSIWS